MSRTKQGGRGGRNSNQGQLKLLNWRHEGNGTATIVIATEKGHSNIKQDFFRVTGACYGLEDAEREIFDALIGDPYCPFTVNPGFELFSFPESSLKESLRHIVVPRGNAGSGPIYEGECPHTEAIITEAEPPPPEGILTKVPPHDGRPWYRCRACGAARTKR